MIAARSIMRGAGYAAALMFPAASSADFSVNSPDGNLQFSVRSHESRPTFRIVYGGRTVIADSPLVMIVDGEDITDGATMASPERYEIDETYPIRGVHALAANKAHGMRITFRNITARSASTLEIRAFNTGAAFRFVIPGNGNRIPDEATVFNLPAGSTVWYHGLRGHYEDVHEKKAVEDIPEGAWAAPPLTCKLPEGRGYLSITESALANYSGLALQANGKRGFVARLGHSHPVSYPFELRYGLEEAARLSKPAAVTGSISTPWRVVMVGGDLNSLVNNDIVTNLAPPPDPTLFPRGIKTDWIKPGRAVWEYLDGKKSTLENMKEYCRMAGELGFEHNVLEGFWRRWTDDQIQELVAHGKERGVGIWLWRHSKELRDPVARDAFFKKCRELGIVGVKIDFLDHEAKEVVDHYEVLLRGAAENRLMVNFHGSNKPTGEVRTWPNELTREAVRGMESSRLEQRARHNVTLPFTRLLAGHADYTPVHFGARRGDTTWAHQIASAAILTSPLLTYAANPRNILANPGVEMMKRIPATWDETIVLAPSEIGEVAVFARRSGNRWFLAVMNGPETRTIRVPLSFLKDIKYESLIVRDVKEDSASLAVERGRAARDSAIAIELSAGGGYVAEFRSAQ